MPNAYRIRQLLLGVLVVVDSAVQATPLLSNNNEPGTDVSFKRDQILSIGPGASGVSKRQADPEALSRLTQIFGSAGAPVGTPTEPDRPQPHNTDSSLERKATVHPSFFYTSRGLYIRCNSPQFVYDLKPWFDPEFPDITKWDFPEWEHITEDRPAAYYLIKARQRFCYMCRCNDEGKIIPHGHRCVKHTTAYCTLVLACFCTAEMTQPTATDLSATWADYQNGLNAVPLSVKLRNKDYRWAWGGRSLGFTEGSLDVTTNRQLVPGTEDEPVYLEGPGGGFEDVIRHLEDGKGMPFRWGSG
ncbi:hypothetical protein TWF281_002972 [Arthrobotrys megalospora]